MAQPGHQNRGYLTSFLPSNRIKISDRPGVQEEKLALLQLILSCFSPIFIDAKMQSRGIYAIMIKGQQCLKRRKSCLIMTFPTPRIERISIIRHRFSGSCMLPFAESGELIMHRIRPIRTPKSGIINFILTFEPGKKSGICQLFNRKKRLFYT